MLEFVASDFLKASYMEHTVHLLLSSLPYTLGIHVAMHMSATLELLTMKFSVAVFSKSRMSPTVML